MNVLDTNVWVYLHDTRDARKQQKAKTAVSAAGAFLLPWQVGCEFIAASRKLKPLGFDSDMAWDALDDIVFLAQAVALPMEQDWADARHLQSQYSLLIWDALLLSTCLRHGVTTLYTEDMGSPRKLAGIELVNPFA